MVFITMNFAILTDISKLLSIDILVRDMCKLLCRFHPATLLDRFDASCVIRFRIYLYCNSKIKLINLDEGKSKNPFKTISVLCYLIKYHVEFVQTLQFTEIIRITLAVVNERTKHTQRKRTPPGDRDVY